MGYMMGIYANPQERQSLFEAGLAGNIVQRANVFPEQATIKAEDWDKIYAYYLRKSPKALKVEAPEISLDLAQFKVSLPGYRLSPPSSTLVQFNDQGFLLGDANTGSLYQFDQQRTMQQYLKVQEGAVSVHENEDALFVTVMGSFSPTDEPSGRLLRLPKKPGEKGTILIPGLQRPVHSDFGDLNGDGLEDIITCEFAKWTGGLAWWENKGNAPFEKHILRNKPGATKAYIRDLNKDGQQDIIALFGQGDEGIFIYYNQGNGTFVENRVLEFPASYGSSYFNLFDFNEDGFLDIIYTNGDNADYIPILKPYHGIRIFLNNGQNQFMEHFFYALNGAYKAIPADFDKDGDMDIAAISFFPDYKEHPEQGFVYLENTGDLNFKASSFKGVSNGRWIVMDAGDADQDGDLDILLGSLTFEVPAKPKIVELWQKAGIPFVLLENTAIVP